MDPEFAKMHPELCKTVVPYTNTATRKVPTPVPPPIIPIIPATPVAPYIPGPIIPGVPTPGGNTPVVPVTPVGPLDPLLAVAGPLPPLRFPIGPRDRSKKPLRPFESDFTRVKTASGNPIKIRTPRGGTAGFLTPGDRDRTLLVQRLRKAYLLDEQAKDIHRKLNLSESTRDAHLSNMELIKEDYLRNIGATVDERGKIIFPDEIGFSDIMEHTDRYINEVIDRIQQIIPNELNISPDALRNMEATQRAVEFMRHNDTIEKHLNAYNKQVSRGRQGAADIMRDAFKNSILDANTRLASAASNANVNELGSAAPRNTAPPTPLPGGQGAPTELQPVGGSRTGGPVTRALTASLPPTVVPPTQRTLFGTLFGTDPTRAGTSVASAGASSRGTALSGAGTTTADVMAANPGSRVPRADIAADIANIAARLQALPQIPTDTGAGIGGGAFSRQDLMNARSDPNYQRLKQDYLLGDVVANRLIREAIELDLQENPVPPPPDDIPPPPPDDIPPPPPDDFPEPPSGAPGDVPGEELTTRDIPPGAPPRPATGAPLGASSDVTSAPGNSQRARLAAEAPGSKLVPSEIELYKTIVRRQSGVTGINTYQNRLAVAQGEILRNINPGDPPGYIPTDVDMPEVKKVIYDYLNERRVREREIAAQKGLGLNSRSAVIDQFYNSLETNSNLLTREEIAQLKFKELTMPEKYTPKDVQNLNDFKQKAIDVANSRLTAVRNADLAAASALRRGISDGIHPSNVAGSSTDIPRDTGSHLARQVPDPNRSVDLLGKMMSEFEKFVATNEQQKAINAAMNMNIDQLAAGRAIPGFDVAENVHSHTHSALQGAPPAVTANGLDIPAAPRPGIHGNVDAPSISNASQVRSAVRTGARTDGARARFGDVQGRVLTGRSSDRPVLTQAQLDARPTRTPRPIMEDVMNRMGIQGDTVGQNLAEADLARVGTYTEPPSDVLPRQTAAAGPSTISTSALVPPIDSFTSLSSKLKFIQDNRRLLPERYRNVGAIERLPASEIGKLFTDLHQEVLLDRGLVTSRERTTIRGQSRLQQPGRRITGSAPVAAPVSSPGVSISTSSTTHNIAGVGDGVSGLSIPANNTHFNAPVTPGAPVAHVNQTPPAVHSAPTNLPIVNVTTPQAPRVGIAQFDIQGPPQPGRGRGTPAGRGRGTPAGRGRGPSRTSQALGAAKNLVNEAGTVAARGIQKGGKYVMELPGKQLQNLRMSAAENLTPEGFKTAAKELLGPTSVGSMVAGYLAYSATKQIMEKNWTDKSDNAKFITELTSAEMGNLAATGVLYGGKSTLQAGYYTLRGGYKAASAFASAGKAGINMSRSVAAIRSVSGSMSSAQTAFKAAFGDGKAFTMGTEFTVGLVKTGGAVFASMAAENLTLSYMKEHGVKSHALLEGNSALAGAGAGMAFLLLTGALSGPVGWAMLGISALSVAYAYGHGAMEDYNEAHQVMSPEQSHAIYMQYKQAKDDNDYGNVYKEQIIKRYAEAGYDYERARALVFADPNYNFTRDIPRFDHAAFKQVLDEHFTDAGIADSNKPSLGDPSVDPDSPFADPEIARMYRQHFEWQLAKSSGLPKDQWPPQLSLQEYTTMNKKLGIYWEYGIETETALIVESQKFTVERVNATQKEIYRLWNEEGKLVGPDDPLYGVANIDPDFYDYYHTNVTLDAQGQIFRAFNENGMLLDDVPQDLLYLALQDPDFLPLYRNYTRKMVELADYYGMSVPELVSKQNMTPEEMAHLNETLRADQLKQMEEIKKQNQVIVDKYNAELAAKISAYGADLPEIVRNLSEQLRLSGSGTLLLGTTETDLYNFLKMQAPEVTFTIPEPLPPFEFDPSKIIDTTPTGTFVQESLLRKYQDEEIKIRLAVYPDATPTDRKRITDAIRSGDRSKLYTEEDDKRDTKIAAQQGKTLEEYRATLEADIASKAEKKFTPEQLETIKRLKSGPITDPENPEPQGSVSKYSDDDILTLYSKQIKGDVDSGMLSQAAAIDKYRKLQEKKDADLERDLGLLNPAIVIPEKPLLTEEQELVKRYQDAEIDQRLKYIDGNQEGGATEEDRRRITVAIRSGDRSKLYSEADDKRDKNTAAAMGMTLERFRVATTDLFMRRVKRDYGFTPEELAEIERIGNVQIPIEYTDPEIPIEPEPPKLTKPRNYTDAELEDKYSERMKILMANYMSRDEALAYVRELALQDDLDEIEQNRLPTDPGGIYKTPDNQNELDVIQARRDAEAADAQEAANKANPANAGKGATMRELMAVSNSTAPETPAPSPAPTA